MAGRIRIYPEDRDFSLYIRMRDDWRCQRCGKKYPERAPGLHCSHFWGRSRWNTRHDPENCDSVCFGCHNYFHAHPAEHVKWKKKQLGEEKYMLLEKRARSIGKKDRKLAQIYVKQLLESLRE